MSGNKIAASLGQYFERRLLDVTRGDHQRNFPRGYQPEFHKGSNSHVLHHQDTGIRVCSHCVDLVERVDRGRSGDVVFPLVYMSAEAAFSQAAELAHREPQKAWKSFVESGLLTSVEEANGGTWYAGSATLLEPQAVVDRAAGTGTQDPKWHNLAFCVALHMPRHQCRSTAGGGKTLELWFAGAPPRQVGPNDWVWPPLEVNATADAQKAEVLGGLRLIDAAKQRDAETVRTLLEARANANFQDARGWTALHAACAVKAKWEVLNLLFEVCDPCIRTCSGQLACDLADAGAHEDISKMLKELMQNHEQAKHLWPATSVLSSSKKVALGITDIDWESAAKTGRRREGDEAVEMLRDFAAVVLAKYSSSDLAFKAFDINGNGVLTRSEFAQFAGKLAFSGDVMSVFKALDVDRQGDISKFEFRLLQQMHDGLTS